MNNLKQTTTRLIVLLFIFCQSVTAQIVLSSATTVTGIGCKHTSLGRIQVYIKQDFPPYTYKWNTGQTSEQITDLETGDYFVEITDANGSDTTLHFSIGESECNLDPQLFFTPNGDGINDFWDVTFAEFFPDALIMVYNKFGQLVFRSSGLYTVQNRWDGTDLTGAPLPVSTYFFVAFADKSNRKNVKKGIVSIIR